MAFQYKSDVEKSYYALFMKYSHTTGDDYNKLKLLGKNFVNKTNRGIKNVLLDEAGEGPIEEIQITEPYLLWTISTNNYTSGVSNINIKKENINENNRIIYIVNNMTDHIDVHFIDNEEQTITLFTIDKGHIGMVVFDENNDVSFYGKNKPEKDEYFFLPMGIIPADELNINTEAADDFQSIEGDIRNISSNININFTIARLWDEKIKVNDDVVIDWSDKTNIEIFLYDKTKEEVILVKNLIKNKHLQAVSNDYGKTIFEISKETSPDAPELIYA